MAILDDFEAFIQEHRRCGELTGGVDSADKHSEVVWMDCSCGGYIVRPTCSEGEEGVA